MIVRKSWPVLVAAVSVVAAASITTRGAASNAVGGAASIAVGGAASIAAGDAASIAAGRNIQAGSAPPDWKAIEDETMRHYQAVLRLDTSNPPGNETQV